MRRLCLHGYWRSSASWRVRLALALKGVTAESLSHHLRRGEQHTASFLMLNPQGMLPALDVGEGAVLTQSLAIIEWLEETTPVPPLLPADPLLRARVRAFALIIAADIHPLQNLRVLNRLRAAGLGEPAVASWAAGIIADGLSACETLLAGGDTRFCFSDAPGLADICLIPQLYNARRFGVDLAPMPRLLAVEAACAPLPAFADSHPSHQPDAE